MTKKEMCRSKKNNIAAGSVAILAATLIWGYGYIVIRNSLDEVPLHVLMTYRYVIAFAGMLLLFWKRIKQISGRIVREGAVLGMLLYVSQFFQTKALGYADTTAGKVAFITALYVVFVPFLNWIVFKKRPGKMCIVSACFAVAGLYLLTGGGLGIGKGDFLALIGSLGFSVHILAADIYTERDDVVSLTVLQFGFAAVFSGIVQVFSGVSLNENIWTISNLWPLIYMGIFSTMAGFFLQLLGQNRLPSNLTAVLLATEAVFGMLFSVLLLGEILTWRIALGCVWMLCAVIMAELKTE